MDLSKLKKFSDTKSQELPPTDAPPQPVASVPVAREQPVDYRAGQSGTPMGLAETWLSIGVGLFLLFFYPRFLQWACSRVFHTHFDEFIDQNTGAIVPYQSLHGVFFSDLGPTLLGIVLIVDGLLLFTRRPTLTLFALVLTLVSTLFNLGWVVLSYSTYGLAPISFLGAIFGGFILTTQWGSYQSQKRAAMRVNA
jgi:hypothetical protein